MSAGAGGSVSAGAGGGAAPSECGDGVVADDEDCDDDDRDSDDGCSSSCEIEGGYSCDGEPSTCARICGNGNLNDGEACDDGNRDDADGCASCAIETHWTCTGMPSDCTADLDANVLISGQQLSALATRDPGAIQAGVALTGVVAGDTLVGIDRRPLNGMLYGLGHNATAGTVQLYLISSESATCTPLGDAARFLAGDGTTPDNISGARFGLDFNPTVDRIRVVNDQGRNFRINPNTGALVDGNTNVTGTQPDAALNGATNLAECAYTNNSVNQMFTTLYTLGDDSLYIQNPPNDGTLTVPVALPTSVTSVLGFDIAAGVDVGAANAAATGNGAVVVSREGETQRAFARIDLANATLAGTTNIGDNVVGLALQNLDSITVIALTSAVPPALVRFASGSPGTSTTSNVTGITAGETLVDIDFRPATGQLVGLGINDAANTGSLYLLDPLSGAATTIGSASQIALTDAGSAAVDLPAAGWSIDFNPMVDRLRVVNVNGLNFRANPVNGGPVDGNMDATGTQPDTNISGLTGVAEGAAGAAYTNSWAGTTTTTLYVLDAADDRLCYSSNPNGGVVTGCVDVTAGGQGLDVPTTTEIDFAADVRTGTANASTTGTLHAVLTRDGAGHLYSIDLATGAATDRGAIANTTEVIGLAVGHATVK